MSVLHKRADGSWSVAWHQVLTDEGREQLLAVLIGGGAVAVALLWALVAR